MEDVSNYEKLHADAQKLYGSTPPVLSPALGEYVHFTAEGFNHIIFKGSRRERERPSQIMRFKLFPRAVKLIALSTTYQEYEETIKEFEVKSHKQKVRKAKPVKYWGIIAITDGRKIKVILRKIGDNGQLHFWSIVPAWTTNKYRDIKFVTTMKGNPDED
jgi:IS4 transposase